MLVIQLLSPTNCHSFIAVSGMDPRVRELIDLLNNSLLGISSMPETLLDNRDEILAHTELTV